MQNDNTDIPIDGGAHHGNNLGLLRRNYQGVVNEPDINNNNVNQVVNSAGNINNNNLSNRPSGNNMNNLNSINNLNSVNNVNNVNSVVNMNMNATANNNQVTTNTRLNRMRTEGEICEEKGLLEGDMEPCVEEDDNKLKMKHHK